MVWIWFIFKDNFKQNFGRHLYCVWSETKWENLSNWRTLVSEDTPIALLSFKRQINKMAKHTQTISRQIADELFECVWPFCGIGAWRDNGKNITRITISLEKLK